MIFCEIRPNEMFLLTKQVSLIFHVRGSYLAVFWFFLVIIFSINQNRSIVCSLQQSGIPASLHFRFHSFHILRHHFYASETFLTPFCPQWIFDNPVLHITFTTIPDYQHRMVYPNFSATVVIEDAPFVEPQRFTQRNSSSIRFTANQLLYYIRVLACLSWVWFQF